MEDEERLKEGANRIGMKDKGKEGRGVGSVPMCQSGMTTGVVFDSAIMRPTPVRLEEENIRSLIHVIGSVRSGGSLKDLGLLILH